MSQAPLTLEILNGPLDGQKVVLTGETPWGKQSKGPLGFPWDAELGNPQARLFPEGDTWWIEALTAPHGTYRQGRKEKQECIAGKVRVEPGDIFRASETWLQVERGESKQQAQKA